MTTQNQTTEPLKVDYTLESPSDRNQLVKKIIEQTSPEKLTLRYLEYLADYIIFAMDKEQRKTKKILTDNRMVTVNKRQMSFEGLVAKFENGEDGIYNMITNDKNIIFTPKVSITEEDIQQIPGLKELREAIDNVQKQAAAATGKRKFLLKQQVIQMRKDQYVLKSSYKPPIYFLNATRSIGTITLDDDISIDQKGEVHVNGNFSFLIPEHVSAILCNYSKIKEDNWDRFSGDAYYIIYDLEKLVDKTLQEDYPLYYDLLIYKIDGKTNEDIQQLLYKKYNVKHSLEYLSSLWRKKIPKLIAEQAKKDWLEYHFTFEQKGKWKRCSRCKQIKLAHNLFFSKNNTSRDGYYSICKACRNSKTKKIKPVSR